MKVLGLVTARGGSKGLPGKNVRVLGGKPLIVWTLEAARTSRSLTDILISTDDAEIAQVCRNAGFDVPFLRPAELAQDDTPHCAVIDHALAWWTETGNAIPDYLLLLQPTSPLRTADDIDGAIDHALQRNADAVVSICKSSAHPYWMKKLSPTGTIEPFLPDVDIGVRRQDLPDVYVLNGALYLIRAYLWEQYKTFHIAGAHGYVMPRERSIDVDDVYDAEMCDLLLRKAYG